MSSLFRPVWAFCVIALFASSTARAVELITNGDFETGDFTSWTVVDLPGGDGSWFIDDNDGSTPDSSQTTVGAAGGDFYAVSDQGNPGTHALIQSFEIPEPASSVTLTYDMFVQTDADQIVDPIGLNHTGPDNQHARVDILTSSATAFDTAGGVVANYYLGLDGEIPQSYVSYSYDITAVVGAGGTFQLRFAEVDNQNFFNIGVDNVSIDFTPVPEPASLALVALSGCLLLSRRQFKRSSKLVC